MSDSPEKAPLSPLLLFISSNTTISQIAKDLNLDKQTLQRQADREQWKQIKELYKTELRKKAVEKALSVDFKQIEQIKEQERTHIQQAIDQLEALRQDLHIGNLEPQNGKRYTPDEYQLTIDAMRKYTDARQALQKMQYKSYGIEEAKSQNGNTQMIFNSYPQTDSPVIRYKERAEHPPRGQSVPPLCTENTTPSDITHPFSESKPLSEIDMSLPYADIASTCSVFAEPLSLSDIPSPYELKSNEEVIEEFSKYLPPMDKRERVGRRVSESEMRERMGLGEVESASVYERDPFTQEDRPVKYKPIIEFED